MSREGQRLVFPFSIPQMESHLSAGGCMPPTPHQPVMGSLLCLGKAPHACMNLLFLKPEEAKGVRGAVLHPAWASWLG